jgi:hypothetical protein
MKQPKKFNRAESAVQQFVVAADTDTLDSACDLLFINGRDLTWGEQGFGLFLVDVNTDEQFEEVTQVVEARSKLSFSSILDPVLRKLEPLFVEMLANVSPQLKSKIILLSEKRQSGERLVRSLLTKKLNRNSINWLQKSSD